MNRSLPILHTPGPTRRALLAGALNGFGALALGQIMAGEEARAAVARAFPDRRIVTVNVEAVAPGGGAIHCITQEQPL